MTAQVAADLRAAADVLERDGWRNDGEAGGGVDGPCRCIAQATWFAVTGVDLDLHVPVENVRRYDAAAEFLAKHLGLSSPGVRLFRWNDVPGRTADEVIAALRAAADRAEAEQ